MSLIQKIQEKGAWIIFIAIAVALIAFIAMDSSFSRGGIFSNTDAIAKVNGTKITRETLERKIQEIETMQGGRINREQILPNIYEFLVSNEVLQQTYQKLGLNASNSDISEALFGDNPPALFAQQFVSKDGSYDANAARQFIADLKKNADKPEMKQAYEAVSATIADLSQQIAYQKYQSLLVGAAYAPKWLIEKMTTDINSNANVSYVSIPYSTISEADIKITDEEINNYIAKHKKIYEVKEELREVTAVTFSAAPTSADSAVAYAKINKAKEAMVAATDINSYIESQNIDGTASYIDAFLTEKDMKDPFTATIIKNPVGSIVGPLVDNGNLVLAKVVVAQTIADTVDFNTIIIATRTQDQSGNTHTIRDDEAAQKRADSVLAFLAAGQSFDSLVQKYSDNPTQSKFENMTSASLLQVGNPDLSNFVLTGTAGSTKIIKLPIGLLVTKIEARKGSAMGYKIARVMKPIQASAQTINDASSKANQFAANSKDATTFDSNAQKQSLPTIPVQGIKANDFQLIGLGSDRGLVRWIYEHKIGDISAPKQVGDKFVVLKITNILPKGTPPASSLRTYIEPLLKNEKKAKTIIASKIKGNNLELIAQNAGTSVQQVDSVAFAGILFGNLGVEPKVVGAAFDKNNITKMSQPIAGNYGVFILKTNKVFADAKASTQAVKERLLQSWIQEIAQKSTQSLVEAAKVEDFRSTFY